MNYAEGHESTQVKHDSAKAAIEEAKRLAEKLLVQVTTLKSVAQTLPTPITQRVKTYEDACAVLGVEPGYKNALLRIGFTPAAIDRLKFDFSKDEIAYRKLKTITKALNEGWEPDWGNAHQYKYWPWFAFNGAASGFAYAYTHSAASDASVGSWLCFKSRELAEYAGKQFIELYNTLLLG